ncbi:conserved protein, unknown function, partial [Hepatocystis sp. ex Piliocolobus tephrosceles]
LNTFKTNEKISQKIDFDLNELSAIVSLVKNSQEQQKQSFLTFSKMLNQTKISLYKMLSEYENRISQLEYNIMDIKKYDPFIENFFNVDILQAQGSTTNVQNVTSSGIVFHFLNQYKYRFIELSHFNTQAAITVGEIDNGVYKKILSKSVETNANEFNSLTCKFSDKKIHIYLNYIKIIEIKGVDSNNNNSVGLFTKSGISEFTNIASGNLYFIKILKKKLVDSNGTNVYKSEFLQSYRFSKKIVKDDLSVYEIPYTTNKDYDDAVMINSVGDLYPVPDSDTYYNKLNNKKNTFNFADDKHNTENVQNLCKTYTSQTFNLDQWINGNNGYNGNTTNDEISGNSANSNDSKYNWKVLNEFGISRLIYSNNYKDMKIESSLIYKLNSCNSYKVSSYIKLENNSEAGLLFRYNNTDNMYILTLSVDTKNVVLKKYQNNKKTVIKSTYVPTINTFRRHHLVIDDQGQTGIINISLDDENIFSINNENYYKSGFVGFFVEYGYAIYDTLKIEPTKSTKTNTA